MYHDLYPFNLMRKIIPAHHTDSELDTLYIKGFHEEIAKLPQSFQGYIQRRYVNHMSQNQCAKELGLSIEQVRRLDADIHRQLKRQKRNHRFTAVSRDEFQKLERKHVAVETENEMLRALLKNILDGKIDPKDIVLIDNQITAPDVTINDPEKIIIPIQDLNFSTRVYNVLGRAHIETLGEIAERTRHEIKNLRGIGANGVNEILQALVAHGMSFNAMTYNESPDEKNAPLTALDVELVNRGFYGKDKLAIDLSTRSKTTDLDTKN